MLICMTLATFALMITAWTSQWVTQLSATETGHGLTRALENTVNVVCMHFIRDHRPLQDNARYFFILFLSNVSTMAISLSGCLSTFSPENNFWMDYNRIWYSIHGSQRINPKDFGWSLRFPLASPIGLNYTLFCSSWWIIYSLFDKHSWFPRSQILMTLYPKYQHQTFIFPWVTRNKCIDSLTFHQESSSG